MRALPTSARKRCRSAKPCPASTVVSAMALARIQSQTDFMSSSGARHAEGEAIPGPPMPCTSDEAQIATATTAIVARFWGRDLFRPEHWAAAAYGSAPAWGVRPFPLFFYQKDPQPSAIPVCSVAFLADRRGYVGS